MGRESRQPIESGGIRPIIAPSGSCACEFRGGNGHVKSHVRTGVASRHGRYGDATGRIMCGFRGSSPALFER